MTAALAERPAHSVADPVVDPRRRRGRCRLHRAGRAAPPRAARPLPSAADLLGPGRGRAAGGVAAGLAGPLALRRARHVPHLALPDRHQRLPGRDPPRPPADPATGIAQGPDASDVGDQPREPASTDPGPDALLETGEAVEEACRTMIELLPPRQRAVLILCEVLRCSSGEAAQQLGTTVAAVNSARQRARDDPARRAAARAAALRAAPRDRTSAARAVRRRDPPARRRHAHGPGQGRRLASAVRDRPLGCRAGGGVSRRRAGGGAGRRATSRPAPPTPDLHAATASRCT